MKRRKNRSSRIPAKKNGIESQNTQREEVIKKEETIAFHQGPIPDPVSLKAYGEVDSTFPNRLVQRWEKVGDHRIKMSTLTTHSAVILSFLIPILSIGSAVFLCYIGKELMLAGHLKSGGSLIGSMVIAILSSLYKLGWRK